MTDKDFGLKFIGMSKQNNFHHWKFIFNGENKSSFTGNNVNNYNNLEIITLIPELIVGIIERIHEFYSQKDGKDNIT